MEWIEPNSNKNLNFEQDVSIDKFNLDAECIDQPRRMYEYTKELAYWDLVLSRAEQNVDLVEAEVGLYIRENAQEKLTENKIKSLILKKEEYVKAVEDYNRIRFHRDTVKGIVRALEHKKSCIENLVDLYKSNYYVMPDTRTEQNGKTVEAAQEVQLGQNRRLQRLKRNKE